MPPAFMVAARRLMRRTGVVGVFWGSKQHRDGGPGRLRVQVREKIDRDQLPANRLIGKRVEGLPTCVVGIGEPEGHTLTLKELVQPEPRGRVSSLTTLVREADQWIALLSGHGTLPIRGGSLATSYQPDGATDPITLEDVSSGATLAGSLQSGRIGPSLDMAIAVVDVPDGPIDLVCPATGTPRPPIRTSMFDRGEAVKQFSSRDRTMREGRISGYGVVQLTFDDQRPYQFTTVLEVHGDDGPFSVRGDSGSLVADRNGRAIGTIIGGSRPDNVRDRASFVLPFRSPNGTVPANLQRFF